MTSNVINLAERIARREAEKQAAEKKVVWMPEWRKRLTAKDYTFDRRPVA